MHLIFTFVARTCIGIVLLFQPQPQQPQQPSIQFDGPTDIKRKFPGLERRKFSLPQKFVSLQSIDMEAQMQNDIKNGPGDSKIGFFHATLKCSTGDGSSSDDEYSGEGAHSSRWILHTTFHFNFFPYDIAKGISKVILGLKAFRKDSCLCFQFHGNIRGTQYQIMGHASLIASEFYCE